MEAGAGRREPPRSNCPHTRYGADRRGGVAGAEPPHKGGPNRPDRPELQWSVVSGQLPRRIVWSGCRGERAKRSEESDILALIVHGRELIVAEWTYSV